MYYSSFTVVTRISVNIVVYGLGLGLVLAYFRNLCDNNAHQK